MAGAPAVNMQFMLLRRALGPVSDHRHAAVHVQRLSRNIARFPAGEIDRAATHIELVAHPLVRDACRRLIFGVAVTTENGKYTRVKDLPIDAFSQAAIDKTLAELEEERSGVAHLL